MSAAKTISSKTRHNLWRFGAIGVFTGLPLLMLGLVVSNIVGAVEDGDAAARKKATTAAIVAQLEKHRAHAVTPADTATLYLASTSGSLARAEIQDRASKLVEEAGGHLAEVQLTATPEQEADGIVAIQLSLSIDNKGLLDLLYAIETGLPLLDVADVSVQKDGDGQSQDQAGATEGRLHVELTVRGHFRKGTG